MAKSYGKAGGVASVYLLFDDRGRSIVLERAVCDGRVATVVDIHCSFNEVAVHANKSGYISYIGIL